MLALWKTLVALLQVSAGQLVLKQLVREGGSSQVLEGCKICSIGSPSSIVHEVAV